MLTQPYSRTIILFKTEQFYLEQFEREDIYGTGFSFVYRAYKYAEKKL